MPIQRFGYRSTPSQWQESISIHFWVRIQNDQVSGNWIPFAVITSGKCVGLTCYIRPEEKHRCVDIGSTYYAPEVRGGVVNPASKHLLLAHAFACGANRVQFGVDALNARSRAAMTRLGATEEGTLRRARITWTGRVFDRVIFSVLAEEWPRVRAILEAQVAERQLTKHEKPPVVGKDGPPMIGR